MDECIERKAVLAVATDWCPDDDGSVAKTGDIREMLDELESIPAANVRPVVRGKWKRNERGNYNCSNCKSEHNAVFGFFFCPNCGADMREVSKNG